MRSKFIITEQSKSYELMERRRKDMELVKVQNFKFGKFSCDVYHDKNNDFFMTRQQIGQALEYDNPMIAISKIHERHKERLDKYSVLTKLSSTDGKQYETYLYSAKGIYEICRWSNKPKANEFYDQVYELLEGLRTGQITIHLQKQTQLWQDTRNFSKQIRKQETDSIKKLVYYATLQGSKNATRYYSSISKLADNAAEITDRNQATIEQLNRLSIIENIIAKCINDGVREAREYKEIYQACKTQIGVFNSMLLLQ